MNPTQIRQIANNAHSKITDILKIVEFRQAGIITFTDEQEEVMNGQYLGYLDELKEIVDEFPIE